MSTSSSSESRRCAARAPTFAIATVVSRRGPVSSHMGDRAIVFGDGVMEGFVGGSCSREVVRRQALGGARRRRAAARLDPPRRRAGRRSAPRWWCR